MKKITIILITTIAILYSCQKEPSASFTVSSSSVNVGENVTFTNTSLDANCFLWDFGDGETSITQSPSHTYNTAGTYTVTLTAFSKNVNKKDIATKEIPVSPLKPNVTTSAVTQTSTVTAVCGGNITDDRGATVTARGVCWNTTGNPIISDNHTTDGDGTGTFTSSITNLYSDITYYVRAYATNSAGIGYGNQISFKTIVTTIVPTVYFNGILLYVHPSDNATSVEWGVYGISTNATSYTDGESNTTVICSVLGNNNGTPYAAKVCDTLTAYGYTDWYLPARSELNALYENQDAIGGFSSYLYWSSTDDGNSCCAWSLRFSDGDWGNFNKEFGWDGHGHDVRCVRRD